MNIKKIDCPYCGANIKYDGKNEYVTCIYCQNKVKIEIQTETQNNNLFKSGTEFLKLNEFIKAKKIFLKYTELYPNDYNGWLMLIICRTRKYTIKDNNALFNMEVTRYYQNFMATAPTEVKNNLPQDFKYYFNLIPSTPVHAKRYYQKSPIFNFNSEDIKLLKKLGIIILSFIFVLFLILVVAAIISPSKSNEESNNQNNSNIQNSNISNITSNDSNTSKKQIIYELEYNKLGEYGKYQEYEGSKEIFYYFPSGKYQIELIKSEDKSNHCFLWIDSNKYYYEGKYKEYNNVKKLNFSSKKSAIVTLTKKVHIYNSNKCSYSLTKID